MGVRALVGSRGLVPVNDGFLYNPAEDLEATGIPVGYNIAEGGVTVESHAVASLVSGGETIR